MKHHILPFLLLIATTCFSQDSLWTAATTPSPTGTDGPVELGTIFKTADTGTINHVRFYATKAGNYTASVWDPQRQKITSQVFTGVVGWNRVKLRNPAYISPGKNYMVSILTPSAYGEKANIFAAPIVKGSLTGVGARYVYGAAGGYPVNEFQKVSYFVDPVFTKTIPRNPLIVNAGKADTILYLAIDSFFTSYQLKGIVTGDGTTFFWSRTDSTFIDTSYYRQTKLINGNTLSPTLVDLMHGHYEYTLTGMDKYGVVSKNRVSIEVFKNPLSMSIILLENGQWIFADERENRGKPNFTPGWGSPIIKDDEPR